MRRGRGPAHVFVVPPGGAAAGAVPRIARVGQSSGVCGGWPPRRLQSAWCLLLRRGAKQKAERGESLVGRTAWKTARAV